MGMTIVRRNAKNTKKAVLKTKPKKAANDKLKKAAKDDLKVQKEYAKIKDELIRYCNARPDEYYICGTLYNIDFFIFKKLIKNVKTTFDNNIFMIVEKCQEEEFIVPIFASIMEEQKMFRSANDELKKFGCHFITIKSLDDIRWKLEEII